MGEKSKWQTDRFNTPNIHRIQNLIMRGPLLSPPAEYQTIRATAALESRFRNYLEPKEDYKTTNSKRECRRRWGGKEEELWRIKEILEKEAKDIWKKEEEQRGMMSRPLEYKCQRQQKNNGSEISKDNVENIRKKS